MARPVAPKPAASWGPYVGLGGAQVGKMIFLVGEIVVQADNVGAETGHERHSTETKITCSHVFVDEILGTWRARSPPKQLPGGVRTLGPGPSGWEK